MVAQGKPGPRTRARQQADEKSYEQMLIASAVKFVAEHPLSYATHIGVRDMPCALWLAATFRELSDKLSKPILDRQEKGSNGAE